MHWNWKIPDFNQHENSMWISIESSLGSSLVVETSLSLAKTAWRKHHSTHNILANATSRVGPWWSHLTNAHNSVMWLEWASFTLGLNFSLSLSVCSWPVCPHHPLHHKSFHLISPTLCTEPRREKESSDLHGNGANSYLYQEMTTMLSMSSRI